MIYWAPFLHFYQPPTQFHRILQKISNESYRPLVKMFLAHPSSKITINMNGVLTELLSEHCGSDIIDGLRQLGQNGQLEFVDSAKYHAILPLIPPEEMRREILLNRQVNKRFFKDAYNPRGFFPPEMCYSQEVAKIVKSLDCEWILLSGIASQGAWPMDFISNISFSGTSIKIFFRDDILSNKISFRNLDSAGFIKELVGLAKGAGKNDMYVITAMDAETFGHHIQDWEKLFLQEVYETIDSIDNVYHHDEDNQKSGLTEAYKKIFFDLKEIPQIQVVTISELLEKFPAKRARAPSPSSWSTTKEDLSSKNYYPLWSGGANSIHGLQWAHLKICTELVEKALEIKRENKDSRQFPVIARGILDRAVHSCQFWWANKERGLWNINMINKGLILQEEAALNAYKAINISSISKKMKKAYYRKVTAARDIANKIRDLLITK